MVAASQCAASKRAKDDDAGPITNSSLHLTLTYQRGTRTVLYCTVRSTYATARPLPRSHPLGSRAAVNKSHPATMAAWLHGCMAATYRASRASLVRDTSTRYGRVHSHLKWLEQCGRASRQRAKRRFIGSPDKPRRLFPNHRNQGPRYLSSWRQHTQHASTACVHNMPCVHQHASRRSHVAPFPCTK